MRLTLFSDYSIRVLIYLGTSPDRLCSIEEIASRYGISRNHLMKVVNGLSRLGYVEAVRGRAGGIRLGMAAEDINIGALIRQTEDSFQLVDCAHCVVGPACGLTGILREALGAFLAVLGRYTLADLLGQQRELAALLMASGTGHAPSPAQQKKPPVV